MGEAELERKILLLRACWMFFDGVAARVSPEMRKGPRGGGRDRDQIIRHTIRTEGEDFAIRHSAYHTLDHAWEMQDKDLSAHDGI